MSRRKASKVFKYEDVIPIKVEKKWEEAREEEVRLKFLITGKTKNQDKLINSLLINTITFVYGLSGTGKTFVSCGVAAKLLLDGKISKIVLTRPQVEVGNTTAGYLPGSSIEKAMPYMIPLIDALETFLGEKQVAKLIKDNVIEILPLGLIRGRSLKNAFIICDESQNITYLGLKTLLTRLDIGSRMVLAGDIQQSDLRSFDNDFWKVMEKLKDLSSEIGFVELTYEDIQRAGIIRKILERL